jgi:integrase
VASNPARSVTHRREVNNRFWFLSEDEEKKLRIVVDGKRSLHLPELDLALNSGSRKGSQYSLTWDMVDFRGRMLNIPRTKNDEPIRVPLLKRCCRSRPSGCAQAGRWEGACVPVEKNRRAALERAASIRRRGHGSRDQKLSVARLAAHVCESVTNERRSAGRDCRPLWA